MVDKLLEYLTSQYKEIDKFNAQIINDSYTKTPLRLFYIDILYYETLLLHLPKASHETINEQIQCCRKIIQMRRELGETITMDPIVRMIHEKQKLIGCFQ